MAKDFKASQIRTAKIVVSGTESGVPALLIYSASDATNFSGGYQTDMLTNVGSDVYLFVSGNNGSVLSGNRSDVTLFGGDVVVSGTFYAEKLVAEVDTTTASDHHISGAIYLSEKSGEPDVDADQVVIYSADDGGISKLYFKNSDGVTELGGGGGSVTSGSFNEVAISGEPNSFVTTASLSLAGGEGFSYSADSAGPDVYFFVSGSRNSLGTSVRGSSVFGGDVKISGSLNQGLSNTSTGIYSHAQGFGTLASGEGSHAEGYLTTASNDYGHSEGQETVASGYAAHSEGSYSQATAIAAHAEGRNTKASGMGAHSEGYYTTASANYAHSEGINSLASGQGSHAEGYFTTASNSNAHSEGEYTYAGGNASHAEGYRTIVDGMWSHGEGGFTYVSNTYAHAEGYGTYAGGQGSHAEGQYTTASANYAHAEGINSLASSQGSHAEGLQTTASANYAHAEGIYSQATYPGAHAEGYFVEAGGGYSHAEGNYTRTTSIYAHSEGDHTRASGMGAHSEGYYTTASANYAHSEGDTTVASGYAAHSEGRYTTASANYSHAGGIGTTTGRQGQTAVGLYNKTGNADSLFVVGHGASGDSRDDIFLVNSGTVLIGSGNLGRDVFLFVSGGYNALDGARSNSTLFGGDVATSGTLKITRDVAHNNQIALMLNQASTDAGNAGSISQTFVAGFSGFDTADGSELSIQKYGPNNTAQLGGPYANMIQAKSGSLILVVGGTTGEYEGKQSVVLSDVHQSNFLIATGSKSYGTRRVLFMSGGAASSPDEQAGTDVNFFVSGSTGSKDSSTRGTSIFGGDVVVSGTLYDGDGNTIGSGGSISSVSGSTNIATVSSIDFTEAGILNDNGSGVAALTGTIGNPEEGSYADGLFTTFTPQTTIGVAIDKINEVLKFLAPSPAPGLDNINADGAGGTTALLSFGDGSSLNPTGYNIVPTSMPSGNSLSTVDINGSFSVATGSSGDLRLAVYNTLQTISGDLNSDVSVSDYNSGAIVNHVVDSFGDADQGTLTLEVNGADIVSVDLTDASSGAGVPGSGTETHYGTGDHTATGFIELSQTGSARTQSDTEFPIFQHRTGKFTVSSDSQRKGYNFAKVKHTIGSTTTSTNFVEWVFDEDGTNAANPISANDGTIVVDALQGGTNQYNLSGVRYAVTGSGEYRVRVENYYKHVYDTRSITNAVSNSSVGSTSPSTVPSIGGAEDHTKAIHVTSSFQTTASPHLGGIVTGDITVSHPTKTGLSNDGSTNSGRFLIYSGSTSSTNTFESFNHEDYRLQSGSFVAQSDVTGGTYDWDSLVHMTASNGGHSDGLIFYNGALTSPKNSSIVVNSGDFRSVSDGGSYFGDGYTYNSQPDYSSETGLRTFYRKVQNTSGGSVTNFKIQFNQGSGNVPTIVSEGTVLDSTKMKVFARLPGEPGSEWLDLGSQFTLGQTGNRQGGRSNVTLNTGGSPINYFTFGTGSLGNNDYFVIKIEADASLTREIGGITFTVPGDDGNYVEAPVLDAINSTVSGVSAKLSFGSTVPLSGFSSVGTAGGESAIDINGTFPVSGIRYGVIDSTTSITGVLNHDVSINTNGSGLNYPADSFTADVAHTQIRLILNGSTHHTMDLTDASTTGESKTLDSGFQNITAAANPTDNSGEIPDFTKWYRTGEFVIGSGDMVSGWNYAKVEVYNGTTWEATNFVEWVRDTDTSSVSVDSSEFGAFGESNSQGVYYQSGVKYFQNPTGSFKSKVDHAYSSVYSGESNAIATRGWSVLDSPTFVQVTGSSTVLSDASSHSLPLPALDTSLSEPTTGSIFVTGTLAYDTTSYPASLPGSSPLTNNPLFGAASITITHPLDTNGTSGLVYVGGSSNHNFLVLSSSFSGNQYTSEGFGREDYRIVSGNYTAQSQVAAGKWDSSLSMNDSSNVNYYNGLLVYNGHLVSPKDSRLPNGNGDFRSYFDVGSSNVISPLGNVNYSSLPAHSSSHRYYYRQYENNTVNNVFQVDIDLRGDATIVAKSGALSGSLGSDDNIYVEGKIPGKTGWLDLGVAPVGGADPTVDGTGGLSGGLDQSIDSSSGGATMTFSGPVYEGTDTGPDKFVIRITAHKDWTGYLTQIDVTPSST